MSRTSLAARTDVRRQARALVKRPHDVALHLARVHASLQLEGTEPLQGALADLFVSFNEEGVNVKRAALQLARSRLGVRMARLFEVWAAGPALARLTPLATRWSVLACPSANISTRSRRCSPDDSRAIALQALAACDAQDLAAQATFLHHCLTCQDRLAFMLVRRQLLKQKSVFPEGWSEVEKALQGEGVSA